MKGKEKGRTELNSVSPNRCAMFKSLECVHVTLFGKVFANVGSKILRGQHPDHPGGPVICVLKETWIWHGNSEEVALCGWRRSLELCAGASQKKFQKPPEGGAADTLISDFGPGEVWENKFLMEIGLLTPRISPTVAKGTPCEVARSSPTLLCLTSWRKSRTTRWFCVLSQVIPWPGAIYSSPRHLSAPGIWPLQFVTIRPPGS